MEVPASYTEPKGNIFFKWDNLSVIFVPQHFCLIKNNDDIKINQMWVYMLQVKIKFSPNQVFLWLVEQGENFMKDQKNFLSVKKTGYNNIQRNGKETIFKLTYRFCKVSKSSNVNRAFFVLNVTIKIK